MKLLEIQQELRKLKNDKKAHLLQRFFKTGKGEYGEGDEFLGLIVPQTRQVIRKFTGLTSNELTILLSSKFHEERLAALLILVYQFEHTNNINIKRSIYKYYLSNMHCINNWDLVDLSAPHIVGAYLNDWDKQILFELARSTNLWERRIAMIATFYFIRQGKSDTALAIATLLLHDQQDLIHKAAGWMLREVGKHSSQEVLEDYLQQYYLVMPRIMLRYAIERFPEDIRLRYLKGNNL